MNLQNLDNLELINHIANGIRDCFTILEDSSVKPIPDSVFYVLMAAIEKVLFLLNEIKTEMENEDATKEKNSIKEHG